MVKSTCHTISYFYTVTGNYILAKDVSLFSASLNGDKKLCDNNEGHIFAGAFLIIGAHFFCYLKFYFIIKENIK